MIDYLQKSKGSEGFHQIINFLNASHIQYALTENPTIYVSFIKQFWSTATARTSATRESCITKQAYGTALTKVNQKSEEVRADYKDKPIQKKDKSDLLSLVEDQGSGEKGEQEVTTADTALNTARVQKRGMIKIDGEKTKRIARDAVIANNFKKECDKLAKKSAVAEVDIVHDQSFKNYGYYVHSFVPMDSEEEVQRLKRAGQDVEAKLAKRQRTKEVLVSIQEQTDEEPKIDELSQEQLNQMGINKWYQSLCSETLIKKLQTRRTLYSIKEMDLETTQNNVVAKLPLLKQGDYEMWKLRIEQYFQVQDYALWEVIEYGNSFKPVARTTTNADGTSTSTIPGPVTTKEKAQKKNDVKARSMLLMALPNEHQLTFNQYKDAKTLFEAIQARFGGNEATKKTQKTLLKQMYENFSASSQESLLSEWSMHVVVWRNKPDLGTISFNDLYNNFKIIEQEVKISVTSSSNSSLRNVAFISTPSSTNEDNTANVQDSTASTHVSTASTNNSTASLSDATVYAFLANKPNGSQVVHEDLKQIHEDDLEEMDLKWQLVLLSLKATKFYQRTGKKIIINGSDTAGYDKSKVKCFNCHKMGHFARECRGPRNKKSRPRNQESSKRTVNVEDTSSKAMVAFDGAGFDWSFMADEEVPTNLAFMAFSDSEFNKSEFDLATYKRGLAYVEEQLVFYKKNEVMLCDQIVVLKRDASFKDSKINALNIQIEKLKKEKESNQIKIDNFENASKNLDKLIGSQIYDNNRKGVGYNVVVPPPIGLFAPPTIDLSSSGLKEFQQPEFEGYGVNVNKSVSENSLNEINKTTGAPNN
ncbi:putative ribonuclease H-like domain-containing protein [Tanacetum coccineum]